jgi:hypothetical protein
MHWCDVWCGVEEQGHAVVAAGNDPGGACALATTTEAGQRQDNSRPGAYSVWTQYRASEVGHTTALPSDIGDRTSDYGMACCATTPRLHCPSPPAAFQ